MRSIRRENKLIRLLAVAVLLSQFFVSTPLARSDEGMWTFDNLPLHQLKNSYGFEPTPEWLAHIQLSTVRFSGGTGAFVSPHGLVLTAHHIARGWLEELSSGQKDYIRDGFYARTSDDELRCPGLELEVLISTEDVTDRVNSATKPRMSEKAALEAENSEIAKIEAEGTKATGLTSRVIKLYQGSEYWLYRYKKYTDVRIVFAPEAQIAFFGGDPDNFVYPRYDLDFAFFRVYENGKPANTPNYFKWNTRGASEGELVFATGHPGRTDRLQTLAQLEFQRDYFIPVNIKENQHRITALQRYSALGGEQARQAESELVGYQTGLKLLNGWLAGLLDSNLIAKKRKEEQEFRKLVDNRPEWKQQFGDAWEQIATAKRKQEKVFQRAQFQQWNVSRLPAVALAIVQYVSEKKKLDPDRLNGFHESQLAAAKSRILAPILYPGLQEVLLADSLQESLEELGPEDPFIQATLNGHPADAVAKDLVSHTKLFDLDFRKSLIEGGEVSIASSNDPLIVVARKIEPLVRETHKWMEDNLDAIEAVNGEKIGKARFLVYGKSAYPDATATLRFSYGTVRSYPANGTIMPLRTTFYGLYDRAHGFDFRPPFDLPVRYSEHADKIDLSTPLNFITTCDAIGGSSGSPVMNRKAELIGLIFDINTEGLVGRFVYSEETNRAVSVHTASILEVLRHLYDAGGLADEIETVGPGKLEGTQDSGLSSMPN